MADLNYYIRAIKRTLGDLDGEVPLDTLDISLAEVVTDSLTILRTYMTQRKKKTIPYKPCIDLYEALGGVWVDEIFKIERAKGTTSETSFGLMGGIGYAFNYTNGFGTASLINLTNIFSQNMAAVMLQRSIANTLSTDGRFVFDITTQKLYSTWNGYTGEITIEYTPLYIDVNDIVDRYWQNMLRDLSIAEASIAIGNKLTHWTENGAAVTDYGAAILQQGQTREREILDSLKKGHGVYKILR